MFDINADAKQMNYPRQTDRRAVKIATQIISVLFNTMKDTVNNSIKRQKFEALYCQDANNVHRETAV